MAANQGNVDVITDLQGIEVPSCVHGPTLLFARYDKSCGRERKFFACSAFRDRKLCPFFQWADTTIKVTPSSHLKHDYPNFSQKEMRKRYLLVKKMKKKDRCLCVPCGLLLLPEEMEKHEGEGHQILSKLPKSLLCQPTKLFSPLDNNKTYAQYLFSEKTVDFILSTLTGRGVTHVLAVGCPRIHEAVQLQKKSRTTDAALESLLLDLDHRYLQVYSSARFCRYNMSNHHFFGGPSDQKTFGDFLQEHDGKSVAMVIDPPFGVMVEALTLSLRKIQTEYRKGHTGRDGDMPVLWFFPYFMERQVLECCPGYSMLDYKVDYDNHALFKGESREKGSPVRIFTNLHPKEITLPKYDGYWFCNKCERYSAEQNKHCDICKCCPTKDGYTYRHCRECGRCVKPSRVHCSSCSRCDLPTHVCGQTVPTGCHVCGKEGHKRRECPEKNTNTHRGAKRKGKQKQVLNAKKRRK